MAISPAIQSAFDEALRLAATFAGRTSPNPCVGAAALDSHGTILSIQAHEQAGQLHAEANVIAELERKGLLGNAHTMVVTLEPCNHFGKTPPCADAVIRSGFKRVFVGATDPNPRVQGRGIEKLRAAGIEVIGPQEILTSDPTSQIPNRCEELIRSFAHWSKSGLPWVTLKTALNLQGTMIPPVGQKTFTSPESLRLAHELRRRADAILTGSGTILADQPTFTVRHISDHPVPPVGKARWLVILDRRSRVSARYLEAAKARGFQVHLSQGIPETLQFLGSQGVIEVLVEAGPTLTQSFIDGGFWNQHVLIQQKPAAPDHVSVRLHSG